MWYSPVSLADSIKSIRFPHLRNPKISQAIKQFTNVNSCSCLRPPCWLGLMILIVCFGSGLSGYFPRGQTHSHFCLYLSQRGSPQNPSNHLWPFTHFWPTLSGKRRRIFLPSLAWSVDTVSARGERERWGGFITAERSVAGLPISSWNVAKSQKYLWKPPKPHLAVSMSPSVSWMPPKNKPLVFVLNGIFRSDLFFKSSTKTHRLFHV